MAVCSTCIHHTGEKKEFKGYWGYLYKCTHNLKKKQSGNHINLFDYGWHQQQRCGYYSENKNHASVHGRKVSYWITEIGNRKDINGKKSKSRS
jgi:hypothetical protein